MLEPTQTFKGAIGLSSMDSMRLFINDELIVDGWKEKDATQMKPFLFEPGKTYTIQIEFINDQRGVRVIFGYNREDDDLEQAILAAKIADVAVGDSEETCGENLDTADLNLPGRQLELVKKIYEAGTPVVLVLQNGRPLSVTWEDEHIPAIVEAWHVGEQGGVAMPKYSLELPIPQDACQSPSLNL